MSNLINQAPDFLAPRQFLVVGLHESTYERWADTFEAETPQEAEAMAPDAVNVAAVIELVGGKMAVVL